MTRGNRGNACIFILYPDKSTRTIKMIEITIVTRPICPLSYDAISIFDSNCDLLIVSPITPCNIVISGICPVKECRPCRRFHPRADDCLPLTGDGCMVTVDNHRTTGGSPALCKIRRVRKLYGVGALRRSTHCCSQCNGQKDNSLFHDIVLLSVSKIQGTIPSCGGIPNSELYHPLHRGIHHEGLISGGPNMRLTWIQHHL